MITPRCFPISLSNTTTLPAGAVAVDYLITLRPDKGVAPFQFTVSGLPSGLVAQISSGAVTISGIPRVAGTFTVQINVVDSNGCTNAGSNTFSLAIAKGTPNIVWNAPTYIYCNTPLSRTQLNAVAFGFQSDRRPLPGTYVYTPPEGTVLAIGGHDLTVVFTPDDTANWNPVSKSVSVSVNPKPYITLNTSGSLNRNDHLYYTLTIDRMVASVTDGCADLDKNSVVVITLVTSDEPDELSNYPYDGSTINDIVIAPDCKSVQLRDERDTTQNGRIYKVTLRIIGNSSAAGAEAVFTVFAPNQGVQIDSGVDHRVRSNCW